MPTYTRGETKEDRSAEQMMRGAAVLEDLSAYATDLVKLPQDIPVAGKSCGVPNLAWTSEEKAIVACYEMTTMLRETFAAVDKNEGRSPSPESGDQRVIGALSGMFFHEVGHAMIDLYNLPATGREEDAVDQLAAVILINDGNQGQKYLDYMADFFGLFAQVEEKAMKPAQRYSNEHSLSEQRYYNLLCYQYGAHPKKYASLVGDPLPKERAERCATEYEKAESAWLRLLGPHLKG
ncbi:DUF4344 domain-containing metallopeptidase [Streptomyces sp. NPDC049837]|uniref:DUF4344 domain-containing metallopeptidase n=1 Tax=Streptomyces sp. NPDC049837 TaxID=3155277 RepID=UPI0034467DAB